MTASIETSPVGVAELGALAQLFAAERTTRHCWCMSFCSSRARFAAGWFGGGNQRRFTTMTSTGAVLGVLASVGGAAVGWGACGPRSRYAGASPSRHPVLGHRSRAEDETVWLVPCVFVHPGHRGQGVSRALVEAAVALARRQGAVAVEGWPSSASDPRSAYAFTGRERLFAELGFRCVERPVEGRAIMRLDLVAD